MTIPIGVFLGFGALYLIQGAYLAWLLFKGVATNKAILKHDAILSMEWSVFILVPFNMFILFLFWPIALAYKEQQFWKGLQYENS